MAEQSDLERTEAPSQRRLDEAREHGQVARSRELATFALLVSAAGGLWLMMPGLVAGMSRLLKKGLTLERADAFDSDQMLSRFQDMSMDMVIAFAPLLGLLFLVALTSPLLLNGWLFSLRPLQPDFSRINPFSGMARMFSLNGAIELAKALVKAILVAGIAAWVIWHNRDAALALAMQPLDSALADLGRIVGLCFIAIAGSMALIAAADVPWQLWNHYRQLKMSREELRREARESDGDPQVKARIRRQQRELARRRMMEEIPKADVVVVNPTHYAVALRYDDARMRAPRVVAKGAHLLALRIREIAQANRVPVLEAPPLARALYRHADLGDEIPATLYTAVAEVLAYVFQLRRYRESGGVMPVAPRELPVPHALDPEGSKA